MLLFQNIPTNPIICKFDLYDAITREEYFTECDFQCLICRSAIGQFGFQICARCRHPITFSRVYLSLICYPSGIRCIDVLLADLYNLSSAMPDANML